MAESAAPSHEHPEDEVRSATGRAWLDHWRREHERAERRRPMLVSTPTHRLRTETEDEAQAAS